MSKKIVYVIAILIVLTLVTSACAPASTATPTAPATQAAKATAQPTAAPQATVEATKASGGGNGSGGGTGGGGGKNATAAATQGASNVTLKITGLVESEVSLAEDKVRAMKTITVESKNTKGETASYTGVLLSDLLNLAKVKSSAANVVFVADDGFTATAPLADVMKCANCILSFRSNGGFSSVMPNFATNLQVKGVVEIKVKE